MMRQVYRPLYINETPMVITNVESSEMIKYASNAFLAVKISFINEVANICERVVFTVTGEMRELDSDADF